MTHAIDVDVERRLGAFHLHAKFQSDGRLTALFGRSGSGKTSLVNIIAGLLKPERGRVAIDGAPLVDIERGLFTPTHRRRIGYVFQESRLFPHLTVRQNLQFGAWFAPKGAPPAGDLKTIVEMLDIGHLLARRPSALSGGEKQRIAIGRALLSKPRLLLMDEPLASLDEARKAEIMPYIERLRDEFRTPIVYVSHSVAEVARLATTVVLLDAGHVVAVGAAPELLSRSDPAVQATGGEAGALIEATVIGHDAEFGLTQLEARAGVFHVAAIAAAVGSRARIRVLASDVLISLRPLVGASALNSFAGVVAAMSPEGPQGASVAVRIDCNGDTIIARITRKSAVALGLTLGAPVHAIVKSVSVDALAGAPMRSAIA
ncbi:molybdenum ABC transporter ATP-binding protein [Terrarubrum flagellatum]|uniref:molybdenum ABC transporter ATP-binding protein n=1 Tax=Terrirubrum flagellatum TaxID=2895980 RepID=UPI00314526AA